jgi:hypothetical protein
MAGPSAETLLRRMVGKAAEGAGIRLAAEHEAVRDLFEDGGCVYGVVSDGGLDRSTELWLDEDGRPTGCSCSCGADGCAHVAAVFYGLRLARHRERSAEAAPPSAAPTAASPAARFPHPGCDPDRLAAWGAEHGLTWALGTRGADLPDLPRAMQGFFWYVPYGVTVADVVSGAGLRQAPSAALQERAIAWLHDERARLDAARAHAAAAAAARATPPASPALKGLWERLGPERARLAARAPATVTADTSARWLKVSEDPPAIHGLVPGAQACGSGQPVRVTIALDPRARKAVECGCPGPRREGCPFALAACDLALDRITSPRPTALARAVEAAVATRPWERALGHLDQLLDTQAVSAPAPAHPDGREPGWRVVVERTQGVQVEPVLVRPYATRDGLRSWRDSLRERASRPHGLPLAADRAVTRLLTDDLTESAGHIPAALALEGHPRVVDGDGHRLRVRPGQARLLWTATDEGGLHMALSLTGAPLGAAEARDLLQQTVTPRYLVQAAPGQLVIAALEPGAFDLLEALEQRGWSYPPEAVGPLLDRMDALSHLVPVQLDEGLRGDRVPGDPRPVLRLDAMPDGALAVDIRVRPLPDAPAFPPGQGPDTLTAVRPEGRVYVERALDVEPDDVGDHLDRLPGLGPPGPTWRSYVDDPEDALELVFALQSRDDLVVEWADQRRRRVHREVLADDLQMKVTDGRDWLGLQGFADVDGLAVELAALLAAVREGRRFVAVDDAAWVRISDRLRDQLEAVATSTWEGRGGIELSPLAGGLLDDLVEAGAELEAPPDWDVDRARVTEAVGLDPPVPAALQANLRPYQQVGFAWLARLSHWAPGGVLADDMGLGKTIQALALLLRRSSGGPALVVAPTSVGFNWVQEAARFAPSLRARLYRDRGRGALLDDLRPGDVLVTSYDLVVRDREALSAADWHTLVLDEAQAIKNPGTKRARAIFGLPRGFCLALTGTPIENRLGELWSLFRAVAPGLLGSAEHFKQRFAFPVERYGDARRQAVLSRLVRPFLLRRLKREVAPELPPRQEQTVPVELSRAERGLYDSARLAALAELSGPESGDPEAQRFRMLAALSRLRQLACHPRLDDPRSPVPSSKLAAALEILDEAHEGGHKALIFSQFTRHLALIREALEARGRRLLYLDGGTPAAQRARRVQAFQGGAADAFLISLKAGGTGLNLTAATVVVHLDPWWNPAVEDQATDRAHRIGQDAPVSVYRMVSQGTIEQGILELHAQKRALMASVLGDASAPVTLTTDDLRALLEG